MSEQIQKTVYVRSRGKTHAVTLELDEGSDTELTTDNVLIGRVVESHVHAPE